VIAVAGVNASHSSLRDGIAAAMPCLALVALNLLFRLPPLLNAAGVNSDAAIAGLQALHFLQGETSRFLWGAGYQGTFEVWLIAAFFAIGGPTPLMLMLAPLTGHLVLCCVLFGFIRRLTGRRATAFVLCLPLVFTPQAVNGVVTSPPRQWSVTFAMCAAMLILWPARRAPLRLAAGLVVLGFAVYLDLLNAIWLPAAGVLVLLMCCDPSLAGKAVEGRFAGAALGLAGGALALLVLRHGAPQEYLTFDFGPKFVGRNARLLVEVSLPWLLGAKVWMPGWSPTPALWAPPIWVAGLQWLGAASIVALVVASARRTLRPDVRWEVRAAVWFGLTASATALAGFLVSNWPSDLWSTRYLAPIVWSLPFSLAALASLDPPRRLAGLLAPYLVVAAVGGWLSYGSYVDGPLPRIDDRGSARDEMVLGEFLRQRGYEHGYAQYWLAHRLTFLWQERPSIAAFGGNRYQPYADAAERARKKAYIFHPGELRATPESVLLELRCRPGRLEVVVVAGFTVILYDES
jgi:hypothetical protein